MIRIECKGADTLPLDAIEEFQGNLKRRTAKDIQKIITSIEKYGFSFPFFIWNGTGHNYCLDGHGRIQALCEMRIRGEDLPCFPVVYVDAKDEAEAKQKLLRLNSQYGQMTVESVLEFTEGIELDTDEIQLPGGESLEFISMDDAETEMPELKTGDKEPFQQMTFTLADEQAGYVKQAIAEAIKNETVDTGINENKNGNALSWICERFLDARD